MDTVRAIHPDCGIVTLSDFHNLDFSVALVHNNLEQVVHVPTRGNNVSDFIVTNLDDSYSKPVAILPLGSSDHKIVKWMPETNNHDRSTSKCITKRRVHSFPQSTCKSFGRWCSTHVSFTDVENPTSAGEQ